MRVKTDIIDELAVRPDHQTVSSDRPLVVLLQGPVGPFFARLSRRLRARGMRTEHIVFNAADAVFADHTVSRHGRVRAHWRRQVTWENWLASRFASDRPQLVVLFGCDRPRHRIARSICSNLGIPILSLEEGYVRPGFVTAEWGGNNRASPLVDMTNEELRALAMQPKLPGTTGHAFSKMSWLAAWYFIIRSVGQWMFPFSQHHRDRPIVREAFFWSRSVFRKVACYVENRRKIDDLLEHRLNSYFVVPLQVRDDMQLRTSGRGWTNELLIAEITESFAKHSNSHHQLVFKVHPLERGHTGYHKVVDTHARALGVEDRVICIDDGSLGVLAASCAGMVTINSTSGLSAIFRRKPLAVLGEAVFRRADICTVVNDRADLDAFWTELPEPDSQACSTFLEALRSAALLPGDFYRRASAKVAAANIADKIVDEVERRSAGTVRR